MWHCYQSSLEFIISQGNNNFSVIDLGCGMGNFLLALKCTKHFKHVIGLDFLKETFALAFDHKKLFEDISFIQGSIVDLPCKSNAIDVSYCLNVMHHIHKDDLQKVITEIERITRKYIIIEIRNKESIFKHWYSSIVKKKYKGKLPIQTMKISELNKLLKHSKLIKTIGKHYLNVFNHRLVLIYVKK